MHTDDIADNEFYTIYTLAMTNYNHFYSTQKPIKKGIHTCKARV